eukprot:CAMPEP_0194770140 /NCGR_PEP_ID=MMETSP0323_2-20130528/45325_1 /TAXON_ID=2866 ORGANISM="Crypthecodinium cohnii, Strain Seligo" /NCGR_SAMPLE_ID=MMETSP0323_2 /ASSEMBLY_ACC=CAM_ASM_000346 /LENGTH=56 /DNA_ID=CAMNT_0039703543 /DNA_START=153 /DNA_END=323 /DNA_ORIENTATION=+
MAQGQVGHIVSACPDNFREAKPTDEWDLAGSTHPKARNNLLDPNPHHGCYVESRDD